jgi:hypothetical protein
MRLIYLLKNTKKEKEKKGKFLKEISRRLLVVTH